ncbi:MAG TPA: rRNA maturation RNase YbeY [Pirellulales bacterium]|nr:rRNA maturation RNase YbeY [Pirellulales bacterium]
MRRIEFANEQDRHAVDESRLCSAVTRVLEGECVSEATISLAIVDDPTIHHLNRKYLDHDEPTDVLSFVLEQGPDALEGEIIVSADRAAAMARGFGWSADDELLLYVIHGALHLVGYDDTNPSARAVMRGKERAYLAEFGLEPRYEEA